MFDYAPAPESTSIARIEPEYGLFIAGEFAPAASKETLDSTNPATGALLAKVAVASGSDVDRAVSAARLAFDTTWSTMPGSERAKYLFRIARLLAERAREFAVVETLDNGKPIRLTRDADIPLASAHFFYYAGWADKLEHAGFGPAPRPLGVAAQVIPWNFPLLMLAWKVAPALAAGNTVVLKPAETTSLTALLFADVCRQAGLPAGVVNIVTGGRETGALVAQHPGVDKVAFTGSTAVGRALAAALAGTGRKLTLELGGKGANIVYDDCDIDEAIEGVVNGIFWNQGHVCCAGSRVLVQESLAGEFTDRLKARMRQIRVGDPLDKNTDVGAINSAAQLERIEALVSAGVEDGATLFDTGCALPTAGNWFRPTLLLGAENANRAVREEIFGPVAAMQTFRTPEEAVTKANNTPYGLAAGVWTSKGSKAAWTAERLRAGVVWTNTYNQFDPTSPFGGFKESGYGREGGIPGLGAYLADQEDSNE